jgi:hypothetical protein
MEGQAKATSAHEEDHRLAALPGEKWGDLPWLALLVLLTLGLRCWQVATTEVVSRDSLGFIRIAWQLGHDPWPEVVRTSPHHPGYPASILLASWPVRAFHPGTVAESMQFSAQLAAALASILLVFPTYFLGKELLGRRVGFWGALLLQCLPDSGRLMGDGLSEPLFLFFAVSGLYLGFRALRTGSVPSFALCGFATGLAYLTRPEGALVGVATGLVLLGMQAVRAWRLPWKRWLKGGLALSASALILAGPFMAHIGGPTTKLSGKKLLETSRADTAPDRRAGPDIANYKLKIEKCKLNRRAGGARPRSPVLWAMWWYGVPPGERTWWALYALGRVLVEAFFVFAWVPALLGLWWFRDRFRQPGTWMLFLVGTLLALMLYAVARQMGYVSPRHTMLIVVCGCYWAVAGVAVLADRLARWRGRAHRWAVGLLLVCVLAPLPRTLEPLHGNRVGYRQAGQWLAENVRPWDIIVDPYCWSRYYAGREFIAREELHRYGPDRSVCYVVLDQSKSSHAHLLWVHYAEWLAGQGTVVQHWQVMRGRHPAEVKIYRVSLDPFMHQKDDEIQGH